MLMKKENQRRVEILTRALAILSTALPGLLKDFSWKFQLLQRKLNNVVQWSASCNEAQVYFITIEKNSILKYEFVKHYSAAHHDRIKPIMETFGNWEQYLCTEKVVQNWNYFLWG